MAGVAQGFNDHSWKVFEPGPEVLDVLEVPYDPILDRLADVQLKSKLLISCEFIP